jgi:hypothetical protein
MRENDAVSAGEEGSCAFVRCYNLLRSGEPRNREIAAKESIVSYEGTYRYGSSSDRDFIVVCDDAAVSRVVKVGWLQAV